MPVRSIQYNENIWGIYTIFMITLHKMGKGAFHLNPDGKLS